MGIEPTADCSKVQLLYQMSYNATHDLVLPQLLTGLLNPSIQHEKYLSPAGYLMMFRDHRDHHLTPTMCVPVTVPVSANIAAEP